jgi:HlyD family secretion protein
MKRSLWVATVVIAVAMMATTYYYTRDVAAEAPTFTTAQVTRGTIVATVEATGTLEAVTTVQVGSQVSGTISALHADFNSEVRKGQIIAELDASLFQTQVEQAQATVVRLQADVDRAKVQAADAALKLKRAHELFDRQLIPATDLETAESNARSADAAVKGAEAQVVQARASLNQAQVNLSHTIIRAPIDGVVIARNVDVGQTVASSLQAPHALHHRARPHRNARERQHRRIGYR